MSEINSLVNELKALTNLFYKVEIGTRNYKEEVRKDITMLLERMSIVNRLCGLGYKIEHKERVVLETTPMFEHDIYLDGELAMCVQYPDRELVSVSTYFFMLDEWKRILSEFRKVNKSSEYISLIDSIKNKKIAFVLDSLFNDRIKVNINRKKRKLGGSIIATQYVWNPIELDWELCGEGDIRFTFKDHCISYMPYFGRLMLIDGKRKAYALQGMDRYDSIVLADMIGESRLVTNIVYGWGEI